MNHMNIFLLIVFLAPLSLWAQIQPTGVMTCDGQTISYTAVNVNNDAGMTLDLSQCGNVLTDLMDYLNCVADNNDIPAGSSFVVELEKGPDFLNGVSTLDLVLTYRHIMDIETFESACEAIGADINGDNKIDVRDLVISRRLILGIITDLPVDSWRYFDVPSLDVAGIPRGEGIILPKESFPLTELNIIGVKSGDVNGSVVP